MQTIAKQFFPIGLALALAMISTLLPASGSIFNRFLLQLLWFAAGITIGAWAFRVAYKGGPDRLAQQALRNRESALASARERLLVSPTVAFNIVQKYLADTALTDLHHVAVDALIRSDRKVQAKEILFERASQIELLPTAQFTEWQDLYIALDEAESFAQMARRKFEVQQDVNLFEWLADRMLQQTPDELLAWCCELHSQDENITIRDAAKLWASRALAELIDSALKLQNIEQIQTYIEQAKKVVDQTQVVTITVESLLMQGESQAALDAAIAGYKRNRHTRLLGLVQRCVQQIDSATESLETVFRAVDDMDDDPGYHYLAAWLLFSRGNNNQAHSHLNRAMQQPGQHQALCISLAGLLAFDEHRYPDAAAAWYASNEWQKSGPFVWSCTNCDTATTAVQHRCNHCGAIDRWRLIDQASFVGVQQS